MLDSENGSGPRYQDLITYSPHLIININNEQRALINKHMLIIQGLRTKPMTVKEIFNLYPMKVKEKTSEVVPEKTLKTVYRYMNALEAVGIVAVAGQRMTEGSRVIEKVYCLAAKYFHDAKPPLDWWQTEEAKDFSSKLGFILSEVLQNPVFNQGTSINTILQLLKFTSELDYFNILEIIENIEKNEIMDELLASNYFEDQSLITFASRLIGYIRSFELLKQLKEINDEGKPE